MAGNIALVPLAFDVKLQKYKQFLTSSEEKNVTEYKTDLVQICNRNAEKSHVKLH